MEAQKAKTTEQQTAEVERAQEKDSRIQKLLDGEVESPNAFVTYLIKQARKTQSDGNKAAQEVVKHEQMAKTLRSQVADNRAQFQKYLDDIREWDKRGLAGEDTICETHVRPE
jgi:hypothetical protein